MSTSMLASASLLQAVVSCSVFTCAISANVCVAAGGA